jgi:hypothetical protein
MGKDECFYRVNDKRANELTINRNSLPQEGQINSALPSVSQDKPGCTQNADGIARTLDHSSASSFDVFACSI